MLKKLLNLSKHFRKYSGSPGKMPTPTSTMDHVFGKYLLLTNTVSSGVLMLIGDVIEQEIELRHSTDKKYDYGRLTRMLLVGLAAGPVHHYYYIYLNKFLPNRDGISITKKILLDQFVMSPICIAQFFYTIGALERKSFAECNREMFDKFSDVYLMDWCVWPPAQFINFYFVPDKYQVLYVNAITTIYNVFLSYIKHNDMEEETPGTVSSKK